MMKHFLNDYGMLGVLLVLCIGFSAATMNLQHPNGEAAAHDLAEKIGSANDRQSRIVIAARPVTEDELFAAELHRELNERGFDSVTTIKGDPVAGRKKLSAIAERGDKINIIATNQFTLSNWRFLDKLPRLEPKLGNPTVLKPDSYYWPDFLKTGNLVNIANQIAIIAIIAIGMTMVIITGGIDLSVGSLIALSGVIAAWFMRASLVGNTFRSVLDITALVWCMSLLVIGLTAFLLAKASRSRTLCAAGTVSLGASLLMLLYALVPFVIAPATQLLERFGPTPIVMVLCCSLAVVFCALAGLFSGSMVTFFRVPPFIVTLAMMWVASGLAYKISEGESINEVPDSFQWIGGGSLIPGIPNAIIVMLALYALAFFLMSRMTLGRYIYAVGGNAEAARLSGVPVKRVLLFVYTMCGMLAGIGGVFMASKLKSASPTYGLMYELYVIAAVVVGGTSLSGGEGKILGTLIGAFIIAVIGNGMNLIGMDAWDQRVVLGLVILAAVLFDMVKRRSASD